MTTLTILQFFLTLLTVSLFNVKILKEINKIQSIYRSSYGEIMRRLGAVERVIAEIQAEQTP